MRKSIAIVCLTKGLEYDERIRKECISLSKKANIQIYVILADNMEKEGITSYGIPFKSYKLVTRKIFPSGKFLLIKILEFYFRINRYLKNHDLLWAHEECTFLFLIFAKRNKFIWDLHEIPTFFINPSLKKVFQYIEKRSLKIIHANKHRIDYLQRIGLIKIPEKHVYIRNYPDKSFIISQKYPSVFYDFKKWLGSDSYIYLQGLFGSQRYPFNSIAAVLEATNYKIVVIGSFDKNAHYQLKERYGEKIESRVFFVGMINSTEIPSFLRSAIFTIVLYDISYPNCRYCEANRFYQAINFSVPIITGVNESMAEIVKDINVGISLTTDGKDLTELIDAIKRLMDNYEFYKKNCDVYKNTYVWSDTMIKKYWWDV